MIEMPESLTAGISPILLEKIRSWVIDHALPIWIERGVNPAYGGPVEIFSLEKPFPALDATLRTRVTGRQLFVFSWAHLMGAPGSLDAADQVFEFLTTRIWLGEGQGWCRTLSSTGQPLDVSLDLYDFSFCIFGLAWYYEASRKAEALNYALSTLELIEQKFRHPSGLGFYNAIPATYPRQQNPHMHLLEAVLKLNSVAPSEKLSTLASEIVALFYSGFYNFETGCLPELFTEDLQALKEDAGNFLFEPGHQFEWAWILAQHQMQSGVDHTDLIRRLVVGAEEMGVCKHSNLTFNIVDTGGRVLDPGSRTWPNTERIKGWLGLYEATGEHTWPHVESACKVLFDYHLGPAAPQGMWLDAFSNQRTVTAENVPASTLYHILLAFSEVLRLSGHQENSTRSCEK